MRALLQRVRARLFPPRCACKAPRYYFRGDGRLVCQKCRLRP